ncbi:Dihydrolipoyllysine-residue acetyltransferase component of acetoin cleaving system [Gracilariopsis chorda]|uniref:Dihydrolipoyllysine-residue acetyltransferase component of acetoin cleaving system n=1 Tax=Gracilariopsis chorda TaxID=448386 RepID=A0A2V3ITG2_9FLOR|nr:Dihydrolipoyllysine-residue acetyltransferase component of acetoin cleaving system [Gracilariopsis chorda]|eukprot:PXF45418.1 Dihydrolipoyllysine-residue acetyltransferase component of acetoin cleaving system [Gracilariopsis chorda]
MEQISHDTQKRPGLQRYFKTFKWRGFSINYRVEGSETDAYPVLIIHGFGASINHWRKNIPAIVDTEKLRVYAIDLLGFGGSEKASPKEVEYGLPLWQRLACDFIDAMNEEKKWALVGNSIGSLISLMAAKELGPEKVRSCALMNCAGGLVSFRYSELNPLQAALLWLFNKVLFNPFVGPYLFENFRKRSTIAGVLKQVYIEEKAITGDLLDILCEPAMDEGACDVFLAILNADSGPSPEELLPQLTWCPILVFWGDKDPWTPLYKGFHPGIDFPKYHPGLDLEVIPNAGHCIHDERPETINKLLVPFLLEPTFEEERGL